MTKKLFSIFIKLLGIVLICVGLSILLGNKPANAAEAWFCSGFFITGNGYIATAKHCVPKAGQMYIVYKKKIYPAQVIATSVSRDLAVIHVNLITSYFVLNATSYAGDAVTGLGFPNPELQGYNLKLYNGWIVGQNMKGEGEYYLFSEGGSSGEPIFNSFGEVEGVLTAGMDKYGVSGSMYSLGEPSIELIRLAQWLQLNISISHDIGSSPEYRLNDLDNMKLNQDKMVFIYAEETE